MLTTGRTKVMMMKTYKKKMKVEKQTLQNRRRRKKRMKLIGYETINFFII